MALDVQAIGKGIDALEGQEGLLRTDGEGLPYLEIAGLAPKMDAGDFETLDYWMRRLIKAAAASQAATADEAIAASRDAIAGPDLVPSRPYGRPAQVTTEILRELTRQWKMAPTRLQVPLNGRLSLKCRNQGIYCVETVSTSPKGRSRAKKTCSTEAQRVILIEGSSHAAWRWGERFYTLAARRFPRPKRLDFPPSAGERAIFDADLFSCTLLIRTRQDGDRFSPLGIASRSRKLKTFFNEEKVPIGMRDTLPIIIAGDGPGGGTPAWVPGFGISDFFKVSGSTSHILELVLTCENP
jgi:tRNA(Ile)-lysidine synthetase-like protein